jgi:glutamate synthase (NADPH/NADH) small chain
MDFKEIAGSEFVLEADLVLLAMGFLGPLQEDAIRELEINTDERSNIVSSNYKTSVDKVFCAGDARRGQSLVVWAIYEGRKCARAVDEFIAVS